MFALVKMKLQAARIRFAMHFPATLSGEQVHGLENEIPLTQQDARLSKWLGNSLNSEEMTVREMLDALTMQRSKSET